MIADEKIIPIIRQLLAKSRSNEVHWEEHLGEEGDPAGFHVKFPRSSIVVDFITPETEQDYIEIRIYKDANILIKRISFYDDDPEWQTAFDLYGEAERYVTGWDKVLSDLENSVNKEGKIGLPSLPATRSAPPTRRPASRLKED